MPEAHERKAKRILSRDWHDLRDEWLNYIPTLPEPGHAPQSLISDLPTLKVILSAMPDDQVEEVFDDIAGLHAGMLHEGIFLLHKSANVLAASLVNVGGGMCTWSISSAYHSAFFAMKSAMAMLGVAAIESDNKHYLVDVWGSPKKPRKGLSGPIVMLASTKRNEQRHLWAYFQRVLSMTNNTEEICDELRKASILKYDYKDFAKHRNAIHYKTNIWMLDDLHKCFAAKDFFTKDPHLDISRPDFSLQLSLSLVVMAMSMLRDIAKNSVKLQAELDLVRNWLSLPHSSSYITIPN